MRVVVVWKPADVLPFVATVVARADAMKEAFGFLPQRAYWEMAEQGKLFVALGYEDAGTTRYLGHVLFDAAFPHGRVLQTHVDREHRHQGVGRKLIQALVRRAQGIGSMSVRARVASDLVEANAFYGRMGFRHIQTKTGGKSRKREIYVRVLELDTPSLLDWASPGAQHSPQWHLLTTQARQSDRYVLDLNVLFDTVKQRPRSEAASWVVGAGFDNIIRLAVTEELVSELERHTDPSKPDPIIEFARKLPILANAPESALAALFGPLAATVFPERAKLDRLTVQDCSDLKHLATSVYHQTAGFVTAEKAILRAGDSLRARYGITVIGPDEFASALEPIIADATAHSADMAGALLQAKVVDDAHDRADMVHSWRPCLCRRAIGPICCPAARPALRFGAYS